MNPFDGRMSAPHTSTGATPLRVVIPDFAPLLSHVLTCILIFSLVFSEVALCSSQC